MKTEPKTNIGRGTLYLMAANVIFLISGYVIHFGLGRYWTEGEYGTFGVILSIMTSLNFLLTTGFPQSASKYIAEQDANVGSIIRQSRKFQIAFSIIVFFLCLILAKPIASVLNDNDFFGYVVVIAFVVPIYALFAIYCDGYLNGLKQFDKQAKTSMAASITKVGAVFALVILGLGANGAIIGYLCGALIGFIVAWKYLGSVDTNNSTEFDWGKLARFGIPATLFSVMLFLLMNIDLFVVKSLSSDADTGYYASAATISKIPYYLFMGLALVLLPSISQSYSSENSEVTTRSIKQAMRYMLMLLIPVAFVVSATATDLVSLAYSSRYAEAGGSLAILIWGLVFLTVFVVLAYIIMGSGKPLVVFFMALPLVIIDVILNAVLIPDYGLEGAALATTITGLLGVIMRKKERKELT